MHFVYKCNFERSSATSENFASFRLSRMADPVPSSSPSLYTFCTLVPPRRVASLAREGLAGFSSSITLRRTDDGPLPRESVGLFRPMNLGVSGESGLASKQIRGKISVGRRRRKDGTKRDGRQTDGLSFGKDLRRNHRCAKPFRPSSRFHTGNERSEEEGLRVKEGWKGGRRH